MNGVEYKRRLISFDTGRIINFSVVLLFVSLAVCLPINLIFFSSPFVTGGLFFELLTVLILLLPLTALHELIHAAGFIVLGKASPRDVRFGVILKQGAVYCTSKKPMTARAYAAALILPVVLTGILPLILVTFLGNFLWVILFSVLFSGGSGDFIMFDKARKLPPSALVQDHPKAPAYYILYESGKEPEDFQETEEPSDDCMRKSPFAGGQKSLLLKITKIVLFLAAAASVMFIIGVVLRVTA